MADLFRGLFFTFFLLIECLKVFGDDSPSIITAPKDQLVVTGKVATFVCTAIGNPNPQIEWRKNSKILVTQRYTVLQILNGSVLRIEPVRANRDNDTYECLADNGVGEPVRAQVVLNVVNDDQIPKGFPKFSIQPNIQGVEKGQNAIIPCKAEGDPEPHIMWLKDKIPIDMNNTRYSYYSGTSLQIKETEQEDQGQYECVAQNKIGTAITDSITLYVKTRRVRPYFSIYPENSYEVMSGSSLNITCVAVGSPIPFVSWKNGSNDLSAVNVTIGENVLKLENIRESANYTCVANSELGNIEALTQVLVQSLPGPPTNFIISDVTPTSVRLSWSHDMGAQNVVYFVIQYKPMNSKQELNEIRIEITTNTTFFYTIRSLTPNTEYEFFVIAVNANGRGEASIPAYVITGDTTTRLLTLGHVLRMDNLNARPLSSRTILVEWDPPEEPIGEVIGYNVYYTIEPNLFTKLPNNEWSTQMVDRTPLTTISDLIPHMIYTIRLQVLTSKGAGSFSQPIMVKTQKGVPSQPLSLISIASSSRTFSLKWHKPHNVEETILGYQIYWNDTFTNKVHKRSIPDVESYNLGELCPDTVYHIWVTAKSRRGEGPHSLPISIKTRRFVPGPPQNVKLSPINTTTVLVEWLPPLLNDQNNLIRGYQIHVHEINENKESIIETMLYSVKDSVNQYNVTALQPDTEYAIQVTAVNRKGDGIRCCSQKVRTMGGVPSPPHILKLLLLTEDRQTNVEIVWSAPNHTYGQLLKYKLKYGRVDHDIRNEIEVNPNEQHKLLRDLDGGARYVFHISGSNTIGWGKESVAYIETPEGIPTAPPQNLKHRLQSPTTVIFNWDPPLLQYRNSRILFYEIDFHKQTDQSSNRLLYNTTQTRMLFTPLEENTEYSFRLRLFTSRGSGPWSDRIQLKTPGDVPPAPTNVQALSTSENSIEVWWKEILFFNNTLGYHVFYTQTTVDMNSIKDLDLWHRKEGPQTWSADITGLEYNTLYAIRVAAYTHQGLGRLSELITVRTLPKDIPINFGTKEVTAHNMTLKWRPPKRLEPIKYKITYGAHKEFYDSQGVLQRLRISPESIYVSSNVSEYTIDILKAFTTYEVNITAVPSDESYRPPVKITVTTAMDAPKPMVKPDSIDSFNKERITVILPQASEECGPISHYYLVVVPHDFATKEPDKYSIEELTSTPSDRIGPYITAKFMRRAIPNTFFLGDEQKYNGFTNRPLIKGVSYHIFVRAVVDTRINSLFTSSPFSEFLSLERITVMESHGKGSDDQIHESGLDISEWLNPSPKATFILCMGNT